MFELSEFALSNKMNYQNLNHPIKRFIGVRIRSIKRVIRVRIIQATYPSFLRGFIGNF